MAGPTFDDRDGWIWFDGALDPWRDAKVHVLTHALHYGARCSRASAPTAARSSSRPSIPSA